MQFSMFMNMKMPTLVGIFIFINRENFPKVTFFVLNSAEYAVFYVYEYENANFSWHFHIYQQRKFHAQLS